MIVNYVLWLRFNYVMNVLWLSISIHLHPLRWTPISKRLTLQSSCILWFSSRKSLVVMTWKWFIWRLTVFFTLTQCKSPISKREGGREGGKKNYLVLIQISNTFPPIFTCRLKLSKIKKFVKNENFVFFFYHRTLEIHYLFTSNYGLWWMIYIFVYCNLRFA